MLNLASNFRRKVNNPEHFSKQSECNSAQFETSEPRPRVSSPVQVLVLTGPQNQGEEYRRERT